MANEAEAFASHESIWESNWGETCGFFTDTTSLSSMQFTHCGPGRIIHRYAGSTPETLQVLSIKLIEIAGGLAWPLSVYGVIAVRDIADHNRNLLFSCTSREAQELKQEDSSLRLIGPPRAIVFTDIVNIEIQLKVKGPTKSQDKALISRACDYGGGSVGVSTIHIDNCLCKLELCLQRVHETVQATILSVQVVNSGSWPFEYGGRVICSSASRETVVIDSGVTRAINPSSSQMVLLESKDGAMLKGPDGHIYLPRQVVCVEIDGVLDIAIEAYSKSGDIGAQGRICFAPRFRNISQDKFTIADVEVMITIAWSLVPTSKREIVRHRGFV
ncbi:uncharacterized protein LOC123405798 [Hordeum vulgare subsp. vulgare]|nr:uncharacterized protein LOC123405798 [Hordeum vulgare subsp. vulgare]